jgi:hypothetical protein
MIDSNLVWYVGYGSNILTERFHYYIEGGELEGSQRTYDGCRDASLPTQHKSTTINHELYFSKHSEVWDRGGVAFVNIEPSNSVTTLARMYLITRQQLEDVAKQETNSENYLTIDFVEAITSGSTVFKSPSWYGKLLHLGDDNGYPVFTLTNEITLQESSRPSAAYLKTIVKGIKLSLKHSTVDLVDYFITKRGINGNYSVEELTTLINESNV